MSSIPAIWDIKALGPKVVFSVVAGTASPLLSWLNLFVATLIQESFTINCLGYYFSMLLTPAVIDSLVSHAYSFSSHLFHKWVHCIRALTLVVILYKALLPFWFPLILFLLGMKTFFKKEETALLSPFQGWKKPLKGTQNRPKTDQKRICLKLIYFFSLNICISKNPLFKGKSTFQTKVNYSNSESLSEEADTWRFLGFFFLSAWATAFSIVFKTCWCFSSYPLSS